MSARAEAIDPLAATEAAVSAWGWWAWRVARHLGYPIASPVARLIEQQKVHKQRTSTVRKDAPNPAAGTETRSFRPLPDPEIPADLLVVNSAIEQLPKHEQAAILRSYRFHQPDRVAAKELALSRRAYTELRRRALQRIRSALEFARGRN